MTSEGGSLRLCRVLLWGRGSVACDRWRIGRREERGGNDGAGGLDEQGVAGFDEALLSGGGEAEIGELEHLALRAVVAGDDGDAVADGEGVAGRELATGDGGGEAEVGQGEGRLALLRRAGGEDGECENEEGAHDELVRCGVMSLRLGLMGGVNDPGPAEAGTTN